MCHLLLGSRKRKKRLFTTVPLEHWCLLTFSIFFYTQTQYRRVVVTYSEWSCWCPLCVNISSHFLLVLPPFTVLSALPLLFSYTGSFSLHTAWPSALMHWLLILCGHRQRCASNPVWLDARRSRHQNVIQLWHCTAKCLKTRYGLSIPSTPFPFRAALNPSGIDLTRCWKHASEVLLHIEMIGFVSCTFMMQIPCSGTSQRCFIGLRSHDCGSQWSTGLDSVWLSRNQFEINWAASSCHPNVIAEINTH